MKIFYTIFLSLLAALLITASVFLTIDGNLAKFTGWYRVTPGMPLFTQEHRAQLDDVAWIRISDLNDRIECEKQSDGTWWIIRPFRDKLDPRVVDYLLAFAQTTVIVDSLEMNDELRNNMRDFGFSSDFCTVTLKVPDSDGYSTAARFTLGKTAPWLAPAGDGKHLIPTTYLQSDFYGDDERIHIVSGNISALFDKGLYNLRDPKPVQIDPNQVSEITITRTGEAPFVLHKDSDNSPWEIKTQYNNSWAEQEAVAKLIVMLYSLEADRVQDAKDVQLNGEPVVTINVKDTANKQSTLRIYPSFTADNANDMCYATVDGRDVVFTLHAMPKKRKQSGYSNIVNSIFSMPVLPADEMAQERGLNIVYADTMPLTINDLRSKRLATFDERDVECVLIKSPHYSSYPLRLILTPGVKESNTQDAWTVEAEGKSAVEAETNIVRNFLRGFRAIPVESIVADLPTGDDPTSNQKRKELLREYGLLTPDYRIFIVPRTCTFRSNLFGVDLPLVKDRETKIFAFSLVQDPITGEISRYAMEEGGSTIYKVSHNLTKTFSMHQNHWRSRSLLGFHISELKRFTLGYQNAPLVLEYDSVAESWSGTLGGVDVTASINPVRANSCVDRVRRLKVREWLDPYDIEAHERLSSPVFSVTIDLERVDYSDAEAIIVDTEELGHEDLSEGGNYRQDGAGAILQDESEVNDKFRDVAFTDHPLQQQRYTIEIAPVNNYEDTPLFYGRIKETRQMFIISFEDAQSLGSMPFDDGFDVRKITKPANQSDKQPQQ